MIELIVFVLVAIFIVWVMWYVFFNDKTSESATHTTIGSVSAGERGDHMNDSTSNHSGSNGDDFFAKKILMFNNQLIGKNHVIKKVNGACLSFCNINDGDYIVVELFSNKIDNSKKKDKIKKGGVLYIIYQDEKNEEVVHKIRMFNGEYDNDGKAKTFYHKDGSVKESKNSHSLDKIKGIVRFKVPDKYLN